METKIAPVSVYTPGIHKKPYKKHSKIKQIQLEQDSGKSLHDDDLKRSLVDLNRAGAPLIEVVFEPDLEDGEEAAALVKELILIVQRLRVCTGQMEEGALRVDANVSVHRPGEPLGTRTEIKNIGSVRGVAGAIKYEIKRQLALLEHGGMVHNETRSWDAVNKQTVPMRDKEVVQDYRYMPEPNLPPLHVNLKTKGDTPNVISVPSVLESLPELPEQSRQNLIHKYDLKPEIAIQLVNEPILLDYFSEIVSEKSRNPTKVANLLINDLLTALNKSNLDLEDCSIPFSHLGELTDLMTEKRINAEICREILNELLNSNMEVNITQLVNDKGWCLVTDEKEIKDICLKVLENNPKLVKQYREGKIKVFRALLGILVKSTDKKLDMADRKSVV